MENYIPEFKLPGTNELCEGDRIGLLVPNVKENRVLLYHKAYKVVRIRTDGSIVLKEVRELKGIKPSPNHLQLVNNVKQP